MRKFAIAAAAAAVMMTATGASAQTSPEQAAQSIQATCATSALPVCLDLVRRTSAAFPNSAAFGRALAPVLASLPPAVADAIAAQIAASGDPIVIAALQTAGGVLPAAGPLDPEINSLDSGPDPQPDAPDAGPGFRPGSPA